MTPTAIPALVQLRCSSLRSKSSYAAFGDFHEEHAELLGSTSKPWAKPDPTIITSIGRSVSKGVPAGSTARTIISVSAVRHR